jgi:hypothetical protein
MTILSMRLFRNIVSAAEFFIGGLRLQVPRLQRDMYAGQAQRA